MVLFVERLPDVLLRYSNGSLDCGVVASLFSLEASADRWESPTLVIEGNRRTYSESMEKFGYHGW